MSEPIGPVHYRFRTTYDGQGILVEEERWVVVKVTEAGYWIVPEGLGWVTDAIGIKSHGGKFVLKNSRRRYAYPDRQEAWGSFCIRRRKYEKHLAWRAMCNAALVAVLPDTVPDREGPAGYGAFRYDSPKVLSADVPDEQAARHWGISVALLRERDF